MAMTDTQSNHQVVVDKVYINFGNFHPKRQEEISIFIDVYFLFVSCIKQVKCEVNEKTSQDAIDG